MPAEPNPAQDLRTAYGVFYAMGAFFIWGLSPVYWKALATVSAFEIILHRVVWTVVFGLALMLARGRAKELAAVFTCPKTLLVLTITAVLMALNWLAYVWAVNNDRMLEASLGYYITPLVNVLLGMVFLGERLRPAQWLAVGLAAAGVAILTVWAGVFPWVSLVLAGCFGFYGLLRKKAAVGALAGMTVETLLLSVPALICLCLLQVRQQSAFLHQGVHIDLLLAGTGVLTGLPLLLFTLGARRITLASLGFIQFIGPSCIFLLGVLVYDEPFAVVQAVTFALIWTALAVYSTHSLRAWRRQKSRAATER